MGYFKRSSLIIFHLSLNKCIILLLFVYRGVFMGDIVNIEIKAWWLLVIPLLLIFTHFIVALIIKDVTKEKEEYIEKEKTLTNWIEKKDILYWLLIMSLAAISLFTFQYSGEKDVISHWGFAGTIVSIILAVVAIGFTLFQTLSSDLSSSKITESAEIISKVSAELNSSDLAMAGEVINKAAMDLINYKTFLESSISEVHNDLKTHQKENFDNIRDSITSTLSFRSKVRNTSENTDTFEMAINDFFKTIYPNLSEELRIYVYAILYRYTILEDSASNVFLNSLIKTTEFYREMDKEGIFTEFDEGLLFGTSITNYYMCSIWLQSFDILERFQTLDKDEQKDIFISIKKLINNESIKVIETTI